MKNILVDSNILDSIVSKFEEEYVKLNSDFNDLVKKEMELYYKNLESLRKENEKEVESFKTEYQKKLVSLYEKNKLYEEKSDELKEKYDSIYKNLDQEIELKMSTDIENQLSKLAIKIKELNNENEDKLIKMKEQFDENMLNLKNQLSNLGTQFSNDNKNLNETYLSKKAEIELNFNKFIQSLDSKKSEQIESIKKLYESKYTEYVNSRNSEKIELEKKIKKEEELISALMIENQMNYLNEKNKLQEISNIEKSKVNDDFKQKYDELD